MRLLRGAGVLDFHIGVQSSRPEGLDFQALREGLRDQGPDAPLSGRVKWLPINELKQWYDKPEELAELEANPIA